MSHWRDSWPKYWWNILFCQYLQEIRCWRSKFKKRKSETRSGSNITGNSHEQGGAGRGRGGDGGDGDLRVFKWETDARSDVRLLFKQMIICFSHTISEVNNHGEQCPKMQQLIQQGRIVLRKQEEEVWYWGKVKMEVYFKQSKATTVIVSWAFSFKAQSCSFWSAPSSLFRSQELGSK